jgi:hypothetical protein
MTPSQPLLLHEAVGREPVRRQPARPHRNAAPRWHNCFQRAPAFDERSRQQLHAAPLEAVEDGEGRVDLFVQRPPLDELEAGDAAAIDRDDLAVDHDVTARKTLEGPGNFRELRGDVLGLRE